MIDALAFARAVRCTALQMVHNAKASHIGSALSIADIVAVLYQNHLCCDPSKPQLENRDRLILSKGHACVTIYAALAEMGFIPKSVIKSYGQDLSDLMNHISHKVPGVEFSTGSLGHGLPFGVGKALAAKKKKETWRTFVLLGDGEMDEGSNWEALMFAAHHKLDNLVAIIDYNNLQSLTTVDETLSLEPFAEKLEAFGCAVIELDGHDHSALNAAFSRLPLQTNKPTAIIARTIKGKGVSFMENSIDWHYKSPSNEQLELALTELNNPHA